MCGSETVFAGVVELPVGSFDPDMLVLRFYRLSKQDVKASC